MRIIKWFIYGSLLTICVFPCFGSSKFSYNEDLPDTFVRENIDNFLEDAYIERVNKFIDSLRCQPVQNDKGEYGIICKKDDSLIFKKDDRF